MSTCGGDFAPVGVGADLCQRGPIGRGAIAELAGGVEAHAPERAVIANGKKHRIGAAGASRDAFPSGTAADRDGCVRGDRARTESEAAIDVVAEAPDAAVLMQHIALCIERHGHDHTAKIWHQRPRDAMHHAELALAVESPTVQTIAASREAAIGAGGDDIPAREVADFHRSVRGLERVQRALAELADVVASPGPKRAIRAGGDDVLRAAGDAIEVRADEALHRRGHLREIAIAMLAAGVDAPNPERAVRASGQSEGIACHHAVPRVQGADLRRCGGCSRAGDAELAVAIAAPAPQRACGAQGEREIRACKESVADFRPVRGGADLRRSGIIGRGGVSLAALAAAVESPGP